MDRCPHEIYTVGLFTCDSKTPCTDKNRICVSARDLSVYPKGVCARKPCYAHSNCKYGQFCYKKAVSGLPSVDMRVIGICCEKKVY